MTPEALGVVAIVALIAAVLFLFAPRGRKPTASPAHQPGPAVPPTPAAAAAPPTDPAVSLLNLARDYKRLREEEQEVQTVRETLDKVVFHARKLPPAPEASPPPNP